MEGLLSSQMCGRLEYYSQSWSPKDACPIQVRSDGWRNILRSLTLTATDQNSFIHFLPFDARWILKRTIYSKMRILTSFTPQMIPSWFQILKILCIWTLYFAVRFICSFPWNKTSAYVHCPATLFRMMPWRRYWSYHKYIIVIFALMTYLNESWNLCQKRIFFVKYSFSSTDQFVSHK